MKIENRLLTSIEDNFRGLALHNEFKLIKTNFDKRRVEATYKHKDRDMCVEMEIKFFIPRFHLGYEDPIEEIGTLSDICRSLTIHENYEMQALNVGKEKISAEFFNIQDSTSIKVTTLR
jgi:hypothetical protein